MIFTSSMSSVVPLTSDETHGRKPNRVRATGCPGGKHPSGNGVQEWCYGELIRQAAMKRIDEDESGKTFNIFEPIFKFFKNFHGTSDAPGPVRLDGHASNVGKW